MQIASNGRWADPDLATQSLHRGRAVQTHELDDALVAFAAYHTHIVTIMCAVCQEHAEYAYHLAAMPAQTALVDAGPAL